jgi:hypothetical protein
MNVLLVDTTQKHYRSFVPLALLRLSTRHKAAGDNVELIQAGMRPKRRPHIIYFSFIFLFDYQKDVRWLLAYRNNYKSARIVIGGISPTLIPHKFEKYLKGTGIEIFTGRDLELETLRPDFDLTGYDYSYGFTSRGCPNKCEWCVVPKLEGKQSVVPNWKDQIDTNRKIFYAFDNNILATGSKHFADVLDYCQTNGIKIDFNQAMDAEILHHNPKIQDVFLKYPNIWKILRFAWDSDRVKESIIFMLDFVHLNNIRGDDYSLLMLYDADDPPEKVYDRIKTVLNKPGHWGMKLMRFKDLETGMLLRKWGGIGDLFQEVSCGINTTGNISRNWFNNYVFSGDFDDFVNKTIFINQYISSKRKAGYNINTKELINFIEYQLDANGLR